MTLQPTYQPKTKAAGFVRHQRAIFFLGTPILFLGTLASALYKIEKGYPQFLTWHAVSFFPPFCQVNLAQWIWTSRDSVSFAGFGWLSRYSSAQEAFGTVDHFSAEAWRPRPSGNTTGNCCAFLVPHWDPFFSHLKTGCLVILSSYSGCLPFIWVVASLLGEKPIPANLSASWLIPLHLQLLSSVFGPVLGKSVWLGHNKNVIEVWSRTSKMQFF